MVSDHRPVPRAHLLETSAATSAVGSASADRLPLRAQFLLLSLPLLLLTACQSTPQHVSSPALRAPQVAQPYPNAPAGPRAWVPAVPPRQWAWIVIHHSDTATGSAASFDNYHRTVKHWVNGLGYDFVIGNGNGTADGQVEVGPRWVRQQTGAHAGVLQFNEYGIGICLVGNFDQTRPTPNQMRSLSQLVGYLMRAYRIPASRVIGHRDAKDGRTDCPGRYMDLAAVRRLAAPYAGLDPESLPDYAPLASIELLHDIPQ